MMKELVKRLAEIQSTLKAPKGQYNSFGKYNYRSCEDILEAVKPLLNGLVLTVSDEVRNIGERYYIVATAKLTDGEHTISNDAYAREPEDKKGMDASQITGSCSSYARKYALNGLFCIDDTQDADTQDNRKPTESRSTPEPSSFVLQQLKKDTRGNVEHQKSIIEEFTGKTTLRGFSPDEYVKLWSRIKPDGTDRQQYLDFLGTLGLEVEA